MKIETLLKKLSTKNPLSRIMEGAMSHSTATNILTRTDVAAALGIVQRENELGVCMFQYLAFNDKTTKNKILALTIQHAKKINDKYAKQSNHTQLMFLSALAVSETLASNNCTHCKGRGMTFPKNQHANVPQECTKCAGTGKKIKTEKQLIRQLNKSGWNMTPHAWKNAWYDRYMDIVNMMYEAEINATTDILAELKEAA